MAGILQRKGTFKEVCIFEETILIVQASPHLSLVQTCPPSWLGLANQEMQTHFLCPLGPAQFEAAWSPRGSKKGTVLKPSSPKKHLSLGREPAP